MCIVVKFLMTSHWLVKAEPLSRLVKGIDVAFSVDRFEKEKSLFLGRRSELSSTQVFARPNEDRTPSSFLS